MKPLCIKLPRMNRYAKYFNETKHMNFSFKDGEFLEVYNAIWERVRILIKKDLIVN